MNYKLQTPGAWLIKPDGTKIKLGDRYYEAEEIQGCYTPAHRLLVQNMESGEKTTYFPGQAINVGGDEEVIDPKTLTKKEIRALMPDKVFPKKTTKIKLLEAYYGR